MHEFKPVCPCHAMAALDELEISPATMPLIGDVAPHFVAQTTNGTVNFPDDYAGRWVILFSHPADFTPVCTSEFIVFQSMIEDFHRLNTDIIGLSVGTLTGHLAWIDAIKSISWNGYTDTEITFPIIDDMTMEIANKYGMIQHGSSDTKTVRAVFIIDPRGIIRTILYYPAAVGRNFDEIRRTLIALQTGDAFSVATPADWRPGDDVLVGAPMTRTTMQQRMHGTDKKLRVLAWFFALRGLSADEIAEKLNNKQ